MAFRSVGSTPRGKRIRVPAATLPANPCGKLRACGGLRFYVQCCAAGVAVYRKGNGELVNVCGAHLAAAEADGLGLVERLH